MIIDDSRNVLAQLKAEMHDESAIKTVADLNIGDIVYLEWMKTNAMNLVKRCGFINRQAKEKFGLLQVCCHMKTTVTEDFLEALDEDLMKRTFEAVHQDYLAGRCIPNSQLIDYMKNKLGLN